ncbi:MAG TPA: hypothetical protein VI431_15725 [Candidatus Acidoferrum sp.]
MQPRVLIICERAAERDTIRVLAGTMGCQWVLASSIEEALALLGRERTSAALLELPGKASNFDKLDQGVRELLVRFPGRIIVLMDESPSPMVSELISKYSIPSVQFDRLAVDLWPRLESMVYPQLESGRIAKVARLILDTFLQPLPAGIRYLTPDTRQLIYEASGLTADIAFERSPDSPRTTLTGQILRTNMPQVPLKGVPVVLKGQKGPLGLIRTNEAGEFTFEFQKERSVSLEIEVAPNDWVLLLSPPLDWFDSGNDPAKDEPSIGGSSATKANGANQLPRKRGKSA